MKADTVGVSAFCSFEINNEKSLHKMQECVIIDETRMDGEV